jgi:hypothetical protein
MATETESGSGDALIAGASMGVSIGNAFLRAARGLGRKLSPVFDRAGTHVGIAASVAAVTYEVYREDGISHKAERAAAGAASSGVNMVLGGAAASAGETAGLSGVAGTTGATVIGAAAPVALSVAAAAATAKVADLAIENHRAYEALDRDVARDAAPQKIRSRAGAEGTRPSILDYKHMAAMPGVTARMRDSALHAAGPIERFGVSGRIRNLKDIDMTDAVNLAEYERALTEEIERQRAIRGANESVLPRWMRHGESVERYNFADGELQNLLGAKEELAMFRQDVQRYTERTTQDAAGNSASVAGHATASGTKGRAAPGFNAAVAGVSGTSAPSRAPEQTATTRPRPTLRG